MLNGVFAGVNVFTPAKLFKNGIFDYSFETKRHSGFGQKWTRGKQSRKIEAFEQQAGFF